MNQQLLWNPNDRNNVEGGSTVADSVKTNLSNITQPRKGFELVIESFSYFN